MKTDSRSFLENKERRQYAVAWALRFAQNTRLDPGPYERVLLDRFVEGHMSLDEVIAQLDVQSEDE